MPSVLAAAGAADVPIVVPEVAAVSLLTTEAPADTLRLAGQSVRDDPWGTTLRFGDIDIDILPFFGEQPVREAPGPEPALRNWGNTYRVRTPDFTALIMADSGADPAGDMTAVAAAAGPVDLVLTCAQDFPSPFFAGVATELWTLPFARQRELYAAYRAGRLRSTSAGLVGAAELCAAAGARAYATYANGFAGVGQPVGLDWGVGPPERLFLAELARRFGTHRLAVVCLDWNPGDGIVFDGDTPRVAAQTSAS